MGLKQTTKKPGSFMTPEAQSLEVSDSKPKAEMELSPVARGNHIGALIIRMGFGGILYYSYAREPPK